MYKPETPQEYLAYNLQQFIANNEFTHEQAAAYIGVSLAGFRLWLTQKSKPQKEGQELLAKAFNMPYNVICSKALSLKLEQDKVYTLEEMYPYNVLIAAIAPTDIRYTGHSFLEDYETKPKIDINMNYRDLSPADIDNIFTQLTDREMLTIRYRFEDGFTLEETGKRLVVTRERVRQIEFKALRKIWRGAYRILNERQNDQKKLDRLDSECRQLRAAVLAYKDCLGLIKPTGAKIPPINIIADDSTPIEELDFSVRTYNCLKRKEINTIDAIVKYQAPFPQIRNLGKRSIQEIIDKVEEFNLPYAYNENVHHFVHI